MFRCLLRTPIAIHRTRSPFSTVREEAVAASVPELVVQHRPDELASSRKSRGLRNGRFTLISYCRSIIFSAGKIPGVIYGFDKQDRKTSILFTISKKLLMDQLRAQGKSFENTVYTLRLEGEEKSYQVIPRQTQFNPCKLF